MPDVFLTHPITGYWITGIDWDGILDWESLIKIIGYELCRKGVGR